MTDGFHTVKLSDEIGTKQAAAQLGAAYYTLPEWLQKRKVYGDHASGCFG
ncbi:hypothetical protein [Caproicibacter fermentans]|uniref:Uncharacterized protein n=1 Tax=Caproicibacter fermentans TaxID=2576756 RepID=A0A7G8TGH0_9FIRM|nr:hypothetical protein [Caproicibacter fermentans]QNK42711.1 hypothetical protein HCR03_18145 [Caproicibacter fermentans]